MPKQQRMKRGIKPKELQPLVQRMMRLEKQLVALQVAVENSLRDFIGTKDEIQRLVNLANTEEKPPEKTK